MEHNNDSINIFIANRLVELMEKTDGLETLTSLAEKSGVSYGTIQRMRSASDVSQSIENVSKVASAFGLTVSEFMSEEPVQSETNEISDVVIKHQHAISVFKNADGGISIVQDCWPDEESIVAVNVENAELLAMAILDLHKKIMGSK